ncbi:MAG: CsgG/HfaB family protein [Desulfoprunum sp.]|nr:CsgG/HfaB family protein [Desulfoprunum sp.]
MDEYISRFPKIWVLLAIYLLSSTYILGAAEIPLGKTYHGPKCVIAVGDFEVRLKGAPQDLGGGLREMLITALFESNRFIVVDRMDTEGLTAEQLLSDSFMADADAVLSKGRMKPAELIVYGAIVTAEAGGGGVRVKIPWVPISAGGKHHLAKVVMDIRVVDTAGGEVVAAHSIEGTAHSGGAVAGAVVGGYDIPVSLEVVKNTPIGLAIRDCIYRSVINLSETIPQSFFRVSE